MAKQYRVRRTTPDTYAMNQATTLKECKVVLKSLEDKWTEVAKYQRGDFGHRYEIDTGPRYVTIVKVQTQDGEDVSRSVIDEYIIEEA